MSDKKAYCSVNQKNKLVEVVSADKELVSGKFSSTFTYKESQKRWESITEIINAIPGARKDWRHWRKTWQDIRSKTKSKQMRLKKHLEGTGGGPSLEYTSTKAEETVLYTLNPQTLYGNSSIMEGDAHSEFIDKENVLSIEEPEDRDEREERIYIEFLNENPGQSRKEKPGQSPKEKPGQSLKEKSRQSQNEKPGQSENEKKKTRQKPRISKTSLAAERLKSTSSATVVMADVSKKELALKEKYYNKKLEYLERQTIAMEKIANTIVD